MMRSEEIERECRNLLALAPSCSTWLLTAVEDDFQRQVELRVTDGSETASMTINTASATPGGVVDTLAGLAEALHVQRTGHGGVAGQLRQELAAAAQKLASLCPVCLQSRGQRGHNEPFPRSIGMPACPSGHEIWRWCPFNKWKMCWHGHRWW